MRTVSGAVSMLTLIALLAGCSNAAPPRSTPPPESASVAISPSGGTVTFPVVGGFGGTFAYSANTATAGASASVVTIDRPAASLAPEQPPAGNLLAAFEFTLNQSITFTDWNRLLSTITLPSSLSAAGHTFSEYGYDLTQRVAEGYNPGTLNGTTLSFGSGFGPVTLLGNHTYLIILTMQ